ncbi:hypothetical protein [Pseudarthrobacter sp. 1C304]|uniref:hypothetical protein n=1 Tax=Pseudarthrobacter sp. 1C304 TaxID=3457438 RepID=UPI003FD24B38
MTSQQIPAPEQPPVAEADAHSCLPPQHGTPRPDTYLAAVSRALAQGLPGLQASKLWFFTPRCLVLDMEWSSQRVAVDMVLTDDKDILVKLHARSEDGYALLQRVTARTGCVQKSGKYPIARVPLSAGADATGQALLGVLHNLRARSQAPLDAS